jgi:hypothetical protein
MPVIAAAAAAAVTWVSSAAAVATGILAAPMVAALGEGLAIAVAGSALKLAATSLGSFALNAVFAPRANTAGSPVAFKADPASPIRGIMGRFGTGGTQNHFRVWGKNNLFISYSVILSLGPIQGIENFTANKLQVNFTGAQGQAANVEPYRDKMWMTYKMGVPGDPALGPPVGISDGHVNLMTEWTANHRTTGYAGAFWTMKNNSKKASFEGGVPIPNWTVLGQKVYDPRKDSTRTDIGGVGPHRWDDWRTWEFSQNPKIHALNWALGHHKKLAGGIIDRRYLLAGVGATIDKIDLPTFVAGANISDANNWTISGEWTAQDDKWQVLASMLQAGSAVPVHVGAKIGIMVNAPRASVATINNDDIIGNMNVKVMASRRDRFNTIFPRYINESQGWEYSTAGAVTAETYRLQDGGVERSKELTYNYVDKSLQAGQLAAYDLANTRETLKVAFPGKPHLLGIKPGDAVTVYSEEHGLNNQKFIVMARPIELMEGTVGFDLRSETDSKHAFALGQTDQPAPSPALTGFATAPAPPEEEAWAVLPRPPESGGVAQPVLEVNGEVPDGIGGLLVEVGPTAEGGWTQVYDGPPTTERIEISGLETETEYYVAITHKSIRAGVPSDRLVMGPYTTSKLISEESMGMGGRTAAEILGDIDLTQELLDLAVSNLNLAIGNLNGRVGEVEADINDPTTGLIVRVGTNENATAAVADRVTVVEQSITTPTTGILAQVAGLQTAVTNLETGKAEASDLAIVQAQINTPTTGLLAQTAALNTAVTNLQTGKAEASALAVVEARVQGITESRFASDFQSGGIGWRTAYEGKPGTGGPTVTPVPDGASYSFGPVAGVGRILEMKGALDICHDGVMAVVPGRTLRVKARWRQIDGPLAAIDLFIIGLYETYLLGPYAANTKSALAYNTWYEHEYELSSDYLLGNGAFFWRGLLRTHGPAENRYQIQFIFAEDGTAEAENTVLAARATSLEIATANLATGKADVARVSNLEARAGGANLLSRSIFKTGTAQSNYTPWTFSPTYNGGDPGVWPYNEQWSPLGLRPLAQGMPVTAGDDNYSEWTSEPIPIDQNKRYCASALSGLVTSEGVLPDDVNAYLFMYACDASGNPLNNTTSLPGDAINARVKRGGQAFSDYKRLFNFSSPTGFTTAQFFGTDQVQTLRVVMRILRLPGGSLGQVYSFWNQMGLYEVPLTATEAPSWTDVAATARMTQQEQASADLMGRTMARWAIGTAVPGADAFIEARAETTPGAAPTSSVAIGARQFAVFNPSGGDWKKAMEVVGGNVILTGGLQAGAFIRLGNGNGWPVALKGVDFNAADGAVVSFGTDLGTLPSLTFAMNNLLPLAAGETYDVKAVGLTSTGFTLSAKINVPGTPVGYNNTGQYTTSAFGSGGYAISKASDPDSVDGTYRIAASGLNQHQFFGAGPGSIGVDDMDYATSEVQVWAKKGGTWQYMLSLYPQSEVDRRDYTLGQFTTTGGNWTIDETLQLGDGVQEVGLRSAAPGTWQYVSNFPNLIWTAPGTSSGTRTALASGTTTRVRVNPQ